MGCPVDPDVYITYAKLSDVVSLNGLRCDCSASVSTIPSIRTIEPVYDGTLKRYFDSVTSTFGCVSASM
ncbi:hypothetical protein JCM10914A_03390 [Paenibacillus sp. JCM 10914]